jgi:hypothetical protein
MFRKDTFASTICGLPHFYNLIFSHLQRQSLAKHSTFSLKEITGKTLACSGKARW